MDVHAIPWPDDEPIMKVPRAGRILGRGRAASYNLARRGEIPVIVVGNRYVVPTAKFRTMLGLPVVREVPRAEQTTEGVEPLLGEAS